MSAAPHPHGTLDRNIWLCASDGDIPGVQDFIQKGVDPNLADEYGYTPLHAASSYGHVDLIHFLVEHGGNVNVKDPDGDSPLHVCEHPAVAEVLINYGCSPLERNKEGQTPVDTAEEADHTELVAFLRQATGLPPTATDDDMDGDEEADDEDVVTITLGGQKDGAEGADEGQNGGGDTME